MSRFLNFIQMLFRPQDSDGPVLYWSKELLSALLILSFFWILAGLVTKWINTWGGRLTTLSKTDLDDRLLQRVIPHISKLLVMLGFYLAIRSLPLHEKLVQFLSEALYIGLVLVIFNLVHNCLDELLKWYLSGRHTSGDTQISKQMILIAEKVVMLFLVGTVLIVILKHFNYDIFSLVTALGIGSLAIGLAAKDTLAHMISGFTLILDRPFQIGDRIKLSNGQIGDVSDIGLRSTKIHGLDNTVLIIPNSDLCNSTVINLVRPDSVIQGRVTVGVGYDSDIDRVKEILRDIAGSNPNVLTEPTPLVQFISFGECCLNMLLLFWVKDPGSMGSVTDQLNCEILKRFREERIEIPYPIRRLHLDREDLSPDKGRTMA